MYKIGELSKLCNISVKTLRYYDSVGLLVPDEIDKFTGYRYYSAAKLSELYRIIALKELGFSLDEIKAQLFAENNGALVESLNAKLTELQGLLNNTEKQLRRIEMIRNNLTEGERKMYNVIIRPTDEVRVTFLRRTYKDKAEALETVGKIGSELPKQTVGKRRIIINYETEYREENFDLAACVEIIGALPKNCPYGEKVISFGESVASLVCPEEELDEAYKEMLKHLNETNHKICGAYYEIYHNDGTVELKVPVFEYRKDAMFEADDIDLPFVDDPEVCGKWEMIDIVPTREHFIYGKPKCGHRAWLDELYFIDGGQPYWSVAGWTKGFLYTYGSGKHSAKNKYTIEKDGEHTLLILEMKHWLDGDGLGGGVPEIWIYEKVEDKHYASKDDLRRCDNIDYPFINDESVLGVWKVRDFCVNIEDFDPNKQNWQDLFILQVEFKANGVYVSTSKNETNSVTSVWTKGLVLNKRERTASAYEIKVIDGKEYLFKEWKSGDYSFGGGRVYWYIFTR